MGRTLIIVLILASLWLVWQNLINGPVIPCAEPIKYSIGSFDDRFGITKQEFLSALSQAESVWETPSSKDLFVYDPKDSDLPINLIYDYRQEVTETLNDIESEVKESEVGYRSIESDYKQVKREYDAMKSAYDSQVATLSEHNATYEEHVRVWNEGNRTSKREFQELEAERLALEREVDAIRELERDLNQKVRELNSLIDRLNSLARELNLDVNQYNRVGASRGDTFAGGIYYSDENGQGIDIYQFESKAKLVRILAHELGHALGLEHIEDSGAIMYRLNQGSVGAATPADIAALEILCTAK